MKNKLKSIFKALNSVLLCLVYVAFMPTTSIMAMSNQKRNEFDANQIKFYDPDECSEGSGGDFNASCGGDYFDITDPEERFDKAIREWGGVAVQMQIEYGTPWSLFFAQKWYETRMGTDGYAPEIESRYQGYNWGGMEIGKATKSRREEFCSTAGYSPYAHSEQAYAMANGKCAHIYSNVGNMIGGWALTYLRNGNKGYQYITNNASADNYNITFETVCAFLNTYVEGKESSSCNHSDYASVVMQRIEKAEAIGKEVGLPTAEEVAKQNNLPAGGKHPASEEGFDLKNLGKGVGELEIDCSQKGIIDANGGVDPGSGSVDASGVEKMIWDYLKEKGFSDVETAGIMGNFHVETGGTYNPTIANPQGYWGIAQWGGSRRTALWEDLSSAGLGQYTNMSNTDMGSIPSSDLYSLLKVELDFAIKEDGFISDIKKATTVNEAAEIFLVDFERAVNGESPIMYYEPFKGKMYQATSKRRDRANEIAQRYGGSLSQKTNGGSTIPSDGSNVTIIGDSITNGSRNQILELLPKADIYAEDGKNMFEDLTVGGQSGAKVLDDLVMNSNLREVLVIALGTNNVFDASNKESVKADIQSKIIDRAKEKSSKIIFVNNYNVDNPDRYTVHNEIFNELASTNPDVVIADWEAKVKANPSLIQDSTYHVHPNTEEGKKAFAELISEKIGAMNGSTSANDKCTCADDVNSGNSSDVSGGMTKEQAEQLLSVYQSSKYDGQWTSPANGKVNCVSLVAYFMTIYTDYKPNGAWGNGDKTAINMIGNGVSQINELKPMTVFSTSHGSLTHTGIIVSVTDNEIITVEASYPGGNYPGDDGKVHTYTKEEFDNRLGTIGNDLTIADISGMIDYSKLAGDIGGAISTTSNGGKAVIDVKWSGGWITEGLEGFVKEDPSGTSIVLGDNSHDGSYTTQALKGTGVGPNKITLHSTEGVNEKSGLGVYPQDHAYLSHFTVDMKNKKIYQHLPITKPADGVASHDDSAGVQIEIMGFSAPSSTGFRDEWYLQNSSAFGDAEWAYLAKLLVAISEQTGIELKSSVKWDNPDRLSAEEFAKYNGVLGHMHVPDNDHGDPKDIWSKVSAQASKITTGSTGSGCGGGKAIEGFVHFYQGDYTGSFSGGSFSNAGCGITLGAMIVSTLTGEEVDPPTLRDRLDCDSTSSGECLQRWADLYGIEYKEDVVQEIAGNVNKASIQALFEKYMNEGWIMGGSGYRSGGAWTANPDNPYSDSGHYVGYYGVNSDGWWYIADPGGRNRPWNQENERYHLIDPNASNETFISNGIMRGGSTTDIRYHVFRK